MASSSSDPARTAGKTDGLDGVLHWVVMGLGAALVLAGVVLG